MHNVIPHLAMLAVACHMANRAYCIGIGDYSQPLWEDAPEWMRQSALEGVHRALNGASPEALHESWCSFKLADGWVWGPEKNELKKTHPCLVAYASLPEAQRRKDQIFLDTVRSMHKHLSA